jgi:hypothetical protein
LSGGTRARRRPAPPRSPLPQFAANLDAHYPPWQLATARPTAIADAPPETPSSIADPTPLHPRSLAGFTPAHPRSTAGSTPSRPRSIASTLPAIDLRLALARSSRSSLSRGRHAHHRLAVAALVTVSRSPPAQRSISNVDRANHAGALQSRTTVPAPPCSIHTAACRCRGDNRKAAQHLRIAAAIARSPNYDIELADGIAAEADELDPPTPD